MQAIFTRILGPTNYRGLRIKVWCAYKSKTYSFYSLDASKKTYSNALETHKEALNRFLDDLKWDHIEITGHGEGTEAMDIQFVFTIKPKKKEG